MGTELSVMEQYDGEKKAGQWHGHGRLVLRNGERYSGEFVRGAPEGRGTYRWPDGRRYAGDFCRGMPQGTGTYTWPNGDRYDGQFVNGHKEGRGVFAFADGRLYEGEMQCDRAHGRGSGTWSDGSTYVGDYRDNTMDGTGVYTWPDGTRYEGQFRGGLPHGRGTKVWASGTRYEGEFKDGVPHGRGSEVSADKSKYDGEFDRGYKSGRGKQVLASGETYEGEFKQGQRHGSGLLMTLDGARYEGSFKKGMRSGHGDIVWPDGVHYRGRWKKDKMHGWGTLELRPDGGGRSTSGAWENGERVGLHYVHEGPVVKLAALANEAEIALVVLPAVLADTAPILEEISERDARFSAFEHGVFDACQHGRLEAYCYRAPLPPVSFVLTGLWAVHNETLDARYSAFRGAMEALLGSGARTAAEITECWGFYGGSTVALRHSCFKGLLPNSNPLAVKGETIVDRGWLGDPAKGVYMTKYLDDCAKYSNGGEVLDEGDEVQVIAFHMITGRCFNLQETGEPLLQPKAGYESHSSPDFMEWYLFHEGMCVPRYVIRLLAVENKNGVPDDPQPPEPPPPQTSKCSPFMPKDLERDDTEFQEPIFHEFNDSF